MRALSSPSPDRSSLLASTLFRHDHGDRRHPRISMLARVAGMRRRRARRGSHPTARIRRRRFSGEHPARLCVLQSQEGRS